ncbi:MAG: undecaprenyl-diphosphate phosphatase [Planctomycetia bacterium]|nr:undecaprenyl-diphosphate phosphatase [Planctomycetia bacterium]
MFWQVIFLAIVQGVTEFLPVSSSGHLLLTQRLLECGGFPPLDEPLSLGILLHCASLFAILFYFWRPVLRMVRGEDNRLLALLVVGSVPVGIVGVCAKLFFDEFLEKNLFSNVSFAGLMLVLTGVLLVVAQKIIMLNPQYYKERNWRVNLKNISLFKAFCVGCVQALAILPGLSRSGSTITAGLLAGLKKNDAATFSFLLAIPAIAGAGLVECLKLSREGLGDIPFFPLASGFVVCFVVSFASLVFLVQLVKKRRIGIFAWYLIPVGLLVFFLG